ncbi:hypothetical protein CLU79DRAFT_400049 [Phycomyces nitens]|nr:hypothetical protein CLU79DRAFT_400049 [Phycomyces nitens]
MKAKLNLHQKGRIDTYSVSSPYRPHSRPQSAYSSTHTQATLLLDAIRLNNLRRLSPGCIEHLARYVTHAWENETTEKTKELIKVMNNLLDSTGLSAGSLDEALVKFCQNAIATPTVCPSVTLLVAVGYIERLKQKYNNIKGTSGCSQRLVMVAYMMAAKFMHANLRSIIDTTPPSLPTEPNLNLNPISRRSSQGSLSSAMSDERITLPPLPPSPLLQPLSPPTSPKSLSDYHYFPSQPTSPPSPASRHPTIPQSASNILPPLIKNPSVKDRGYGVFRMEYEFLHFLNYNLSLSNPSSLVHWAHHMDSC